MFNTAHAPFGDKLVRQALHYAIDSKKMIEIGLKGAGTAGTSFINPKLAVVAAGGPRLRLRPREGEGSCCRRPASAG